MPRLDLIEACWRVVGPSGKPIACGIYRSDAGVEVRAGYSINDVVRSEFASEIGAAREIAEAWKLAALAKGFEAYTEQGR